MKQNVFRKSGQRLLSMVLVLLMVLQMIPVSTVYAAAAKTAGVGDETGVVVSIENYETGEFVLEPTRVNTTAKRLDLLRAAFEKNSIQDAQLEQQQFDWCLDAITNIQGVKSDDYNASNDTGNRAWLLVKNNAYDLWEYTNWKNTAENDVFRVVYTTNHGTDCGLNGATSGSATMKVNKDALVSAIADARRDFADKTEAIAAAEAVVLDTAADAQAVTAAIEALQDALTQPDTPASPSVGDAEGVVVSIENYETGEFTLEPIRVANNGIKLNLLRAAFEKAGIMDAVLEQKQFDWCLDAITNIQGAVADEYTGSNDTGSRAWLLIKNNHYDLWDYTNWKTTDNDTVVRVVYTTNHGADCGFTGTTADTGSMQVNKDALITAIADARRDFADKTEAIAAAEAVVLNTAADEKAVAAALEALQNALTQPDTPAVPSVGDAEGVVVSIENYESGEFTLEPIRVANNGAKLNLLRAAFEKAGIMDATLEEQQFDWSLDGITNIQGVKSDAYNGSNDTGAKAWLLIKNNAYDLWTYTNWKNTPNDTVIRVVYTTNHGADCGFTGTTADTGSMQVNKDALITAIADARRDFPDKTEAIQAAEAVVLNTSASAETVAAALAELESALSGGSGEKLESITIDGEREVTVHAGEKHTFTATKNPAGAAGEITWKVSGELASIDEKTGELTAGKTPGQVTVTAQVGLKKDTVTVTIDSPATGVEITSSETTVVEGKTITLTAQVSPETSTDKVVWSSESEEIAKVDAQTGVVTGVKAGTTTIVATAGAHSARVEITVRAIPATDLTVEPAALELAIGRKAQLKAIVTPEDTTEQLTWSVKDDSKLVSVAPDGTVTAGMETGKATIVATVGKISREIPVTVITIPAQSITMEESLTIRADKSAQLHAVVNPEDTTDQIVWTSEHEDIATVENGLVKALRPGTTTITATAGAHSAQTKVEVTEGAYVYFDFSDGRPDQKLEDNTITLTPVDAGSFKIANFDGQVHFDSEVTVVTDSDGLYSDKYLVHSTGKFQPFGNEVQTKFSVRAWADFDGEHREFTVNLVPSDITEIRLLVGSQVVSNDTYHQVGASQFYLTVQGRASDEEEFRNLPASAVNFYSENQTYATVDAHGMVRPYQGRAKIHADLKCSDVSTWMVASFAEVPVESFELSIPETNYIDKWNSLGNYYVGVQPNTGFRVTYSPSDTTQKGLVWEALTPEIATYMAAFDNGIIPKRAGTAKFKVSSAFNPEISQIVEVNFAYKTPVQSVKMDKTYFELGVGNTEQLRFTFNPGDASEQRFDWTFSEPGIIQINESVKTDMSGTSAKWFEHELVGLKAGTVSVTGTAMDKTHGAQTVTFTVKVGNGGDTPVNPGKVDVSALLNHGLTSLAKQSHTAYEDEWTIFPLLRAGKTLSEADKSAYLASVKSALETKRLDPTDYARVIFTLTAMGIDAQHFMGHDLVTEMCSNPRLFHLTSNQIIWTLIAVDTHGYTIPESTGITRDKLVKEIVKYQREDGSFSLNPGDFTGSIDLTAMALQALARYQYDGSVREAITRGIAYLQTRINGDAGFVAEGGENACSAAQVITGLSALGKDAADPAVGFTRNGKNMLDRLSVFKLSDGFAVLAGQEAYNLMATQQVTYALEAYRRTVANENALYDLSDVKITPYEDQTSIDQAAADKVTKLIASLPEKVALSDADAIHQARQAFQDLTPAQRKLVKNEAKLIAAEKALEALQPEQPQGEDYIIFSVERFTIGQGFYTEPIRVPLQEGDTVSDIIKRVVGTDKLEMNSGDNYLVGITDANLGPDHVSVPEYISKMDAYAPTTQDTIEYYNDQGFTEDEQGMLAEFTYNTQAGWYYFVNNVAPSVGINNWTPESGDVVRVQYTLYGTGADLTGIKYGAPEPFVEISDKDDLYRVMAEVNAADEAIRTNPGVESAYAAASAAAQGIITAQDEVDRAAAALRTAMEEAAKPATDHRVVLENTGNNLLEFARKEAPIVGSVGGEWLVLGLVRSGKTEGVDLDAYYKNVVDFVVNNINDREQLHRAKSTENARVILALTALGYDVTDVAGHNLLQGLSDMKFVKKQGINGPIWALIALDSHNYEIPVNADPAQQVTRDKLIEEVLSKQLPDGGWDLANRAADSDMTGMALQALAPYYESNEAVKAAVDKALVCVSKIQNEDGTFGSVDGKCAESSAQILAGLTALGIDPAKDPRFIKNGHSVVDGHLTFAIKEGTDGFRHILSGDRDQMATEQAYYGLVAYDRFVKGANRLYDMTDVTIRETNLAQPEVSLKNIASTGKITLTWPAVDGATGYQVYVREGKTGDFRLLKKVSGTRLNHTSAQAGETYYYQVRALAGSQEGPFSDVKHRTCDLPQTEITFSVRNDGKPIIRWQKVDGAVKYEVYRSVDGGKFEKFYTTTGTQVTNGSAKTGHTYAYQVKAICANKYGSSALSEAASILCGKAPVVKLTANASTGKTVLTWNKVPGAVEYEVYVKVGKNGTYELLHTAKSTKLTHGSAKAGKTYYYQICAVAADGSKTVLSAEKHRTTDLARPSVKLATRNGDPYLTWNKVQGAIKYEVWCADGKGAYTKLFTTTGTRLTHGSAKAGHTYSYKVRAICSNSYGNSAYSAPVSMKVK